MNKYHKIQTVFKRDPVTKYKTLLVGKYALSEFAFLKNNLWEFSEKIDGTNIRIIYKGNTVSFKGKTDRAEMYPGMLEYLKSYFWPLVENDSFKLNSDENDVSICLYGEGCGAGIQKGGGRYYKGQRFVLFDVMVNGTWLERVCVENIAKRLLIPVAPIIGTGTLSDMVQKVRNGFKSLWGDFRAEGVVARPVTELCDRFGGRIITKLKWRDFHQKP